MNPKLTYLLIIISFLITSCASDPLDHKDVAQGTELSFNVSNRSRGSLTTSIDHFDVFGDIRFAGNTTLAPVVLFNKTKVEYINGNWTYEGVQYWMPNYEHSFVAVSPETALGSSPRYLNSQLSFDYSLPATGKADDILVATHRRMYTDDGFSSTAEKITFTFGHLLSLINIAPAFYDNILSSEDYILFHNVEFSGVKTAVRFDIEPAPRQSNNQTDDMTIDAIGQEEGSFTIALRTPVKVLNDATNVRLFTDDDAIIVLPQSFDAESEAKITLSYTINEEATMNRVSIPLKNLTWESGKNYIYRFTIERYGVEFDICEINPWNLVEGEEIIVE